MDQLAFRTSADTFADTLRTNLPLGSGHFGHSGHTSLEVSGMSVCPPDVEERGNGPSNCDFRRALSPKPTRTQMRNQRRAMRSDFKPEQLLPEVDVTPSAADDLVSDIPF